MERDDADRDDTLPWLLAQQGVAPAAFAGQRPDFLVISPPKTGSTWLAENLRRHPGVFVPGVKEVRYFSSWHRWLDLNWYLNHFAEGTGRVKGEASPSYAVLPVRRIRLVRRLLPRVKLIFLMRDPVARAWSHARHTLRYREANFAAGDRDPAAVPDDRWAENFAHDWPLASGDYLGQLRRWLSVFPREQVFVGFYESIAREPESLLRRVLAFLGADPNVDLGGFPLRDRILPGLPRDLTPALADRLRGLLAGRSRELAGFLRERFGLTPPAEWGATLGGPGESEGPAPAAFARAADDDYLDSVLAHEERSAGCRPVLLDYRGFAVVWCGGELHAIDHDPEPVRVDLLDAAALARYRAERVCFTAATLAAVKECIDQCRYSQVRAMRGEYLARIEEVRNELRAERGWVVGLEDAIRTTAAVVRRLDAEASGVRPLSAIINRVLRPAWRQLRGVFRLSAAPRA